MKKKGVISATLVLVMIVTLLGSLVVTPVSATEDIVVPSISDPIPEGDILNGEGDFNSPSDLNRWKSNYTGQTMTYLEDDNGGCVRFGGILLNNYGFRYTPSTTVTPGLYKITIYIRTAKPNAFSYNRLYIKDVGGNTYIFKLYPTNEWLKGEFYLDLKQNIQYIDIFGGPSAGYVQTYVVDNLSMVPVTSIPAGASDSAGTLMGTSSEAYEIDKGLYEDLIYEPYDAEKNAQYAVQGITINQDADSYATGLAGMTEKAIRDQALNIANTHITDYVFCVNNRSSTYPTDVWPDIAEKYYIKNEGGISVDYTQNSYVLGAYNTFIRDGIDGYKIMLDELPKHNINPWISIRMNDIHGNESSLRHLLSSTYFDHPEWFRVRYDSKISVKGWGGLDKALDYGQEAVREYFLSYIEETLDRYDMYGLELDYKRNISLFQYGKEYPGIEILNDFMRDVQKLVARAEIKHGHAIKIAVIIAPEYETNVDLGLDVLTWVDEGIVDRVIIKSDYDTTYNDIPIKLWDTLLSPYNVELCAGIEYLLDTMGGKLAGVPTYETLAAACANYLSQGADNIYLYNYYGGLGKSYSDEEKVTSQDSNIGLKSDMGYWNMITTMGSYEKLMLSNRRMVLTYNDTQVYWHDQFRPLPLSIMKGNTRTLSMSIGDVYEGCKLTFKFSAPDACTEEGKIPTVVINGIEVKYIGYESNPLGLISNRVLMYEVPTELNDDMYLSADITANEYTLIQYAEIYVDATNAVAPAK